MQITVIRKYRKNSYTIGEIFIDGKYFSNSVEDKDRGLTDDMSEEEIASKKVYGETAIPLGEYEVKMTVSPKFKNSTWGKKWNGIVPEIVNVKGFSGIRIHPLNTAKDSLGCIGPGENKIVGGVVNSQSTYHRLMKILTSTNEKITIKITH